MTLSLNQNRITYSGNSSSTAFSVPFYFLAAADLVVYLRDNTLLTETLQVITTNYTVTGAGSTNPVGGTVTMLAAPPTGTTLVIYREPDRLQSLHPQDNTAIPASDLEVALDKEEMHAQRLYEEVSRCVRLSPAQTATFDPHLPTAVVNSPGAALVINGSGNGLAIGPTEGDIANAQANALAAAASATAAAGSQTAAATSATNAASSATAASASQTAAAASATAAATSATSASGSAATATTQASNASTSASSASTSATNAASSATSAASSSSSASTSATNASTSATNAATSATSASGSATSAAASAATAGSSIFNQGVVTKSANYTVVSADTGKLILVDATSGNVTLTFTQISSLTLPFTCGVFRIDGSANTVTLQRSGADLINGAASQTIPIQYAGGLLTGSGTAWEFLPSNTLSAGAVTLAMLANLANQRVIGRNTAGTGVPEAVTFSQLMDWISGSVAQGDIAYRDSASWARLGAGTKGQHLKTNGTSANPAWVDAPVSGVSGGYVTRSGSNLLFAPDVSNRFWCFENSSWVEKIIPDAGVTVACTSLTASSDYQLYAYDNSGTVTLDLVTGSTITTQNGINVKSGATSRTLIARCRTDGSGNILSFNEDASQHLIGNLYNKRNISLKKTESTASWTYNSTTIRSANNSTSNRVQFVTDGKDHIHARVLAALFASSGSPNDGTSGIGLDSTSADSSVIHERYTAAGSVGTTMAEYVGAPSAGFHFLQWLESTDGGVNTTTWYGTNSASQFTQSGIVAVIRA